MRRIDHDLAKKRGAVVREEIHNSGMTYEAVAAALNYADKSTIHRKDRADGSSYSDTDCDNLAPLLRVRSQYLKQAKEYVSAEIPIEFSKGDVHAYWDSVREYVSDYIRTDEELKTANAFFDSAEENTAKDQFILQHTGFYVMRLSGMDSVTLWKPGTLIKTTDAELDRVIDPALTAAISAISPSVS